MKEKSTRSRYALEFKQEARRLVKAADKASRSAVSVKRCLSEYDVVFLITPPDVLLT